MPDHVLHLNFIDSVGYAVTSALRAADESADRTDRECWLALARGWRRLGHAAATDAIIHPAMKAAA